MAARVAVTRDWVVQERREYSSMLNCEFTREILGIMIILSLSGKMQKWIILLLTVRWT